MCPAGICKNLIKYEIIPQNCQGCTACARVCPTQAISGELRKPHFIDQTKCIKCGSCILLVDLMQLKLSNQEVIFRCPRFI